MSKYTTPDIGTVLPAQRNTAYTNPGPVHDQDVMNEWLQAQAQATAARQNDNLTEAWTNGTWANWLGNYQIGRQKGTTGVMGDPDAPPPQPPPAFVCVVIAAEAALVTFDVQPSGQPARTDENGTAPATGPYIPVCAIPAYDKITAPQKPGTGKIKD
jgi:hypothetical protein